MWRRNVVNGGIKLKQKKKVQKLNNIHFHIQFSNIILGKCVDFVIVLKVQFSKIKIWFEMKTNRN